MAPRQRFASSRNGPPAYYAIVQEANLKARGYASGDWLYYGALTRLSPAERKLVNLALDLVQSPA